jgi:aspartokinase
MERLKIYDILHNENLCQVKLTTKNNSYVEDLFNQLGNREIKIKFFAFHQDGNESSQFAFCIQKSELKTTQKILTEIPFYEKDIHINTEVGMIAIYGPHFVEKPGIIHAMHSALTSQGINILAISTTISTSFFIIPSSNVIRAVTCLRENFEIPTGKV